MEIKLETLWEELEFDETLKEYVEGKVKEKVNRLIKQITEQANKAIETKIEVAIEEISNELASIKGFIKCADTKINEHLLSHCELPEEYKPIWIENNKSFFWRAAANYLKSRGIILGDILKYRIGYCEEGAFKNMIIIPSYDANGSLNYFVTRAFMPNAPMKFKNLKLDRDIIGFDITINWDEPIILVESAFDAITIRRNAIPLFGKSILSKLKMQLIEKKVNTIILCFDGDATKDAINYVPYFLGNGIHVYVVESLEDDDPSSLGYDRIWNELDQATYFDNKLLFERTIKYRLDGKGKTHLPRRRYTYNKR